jgi:LacI family transcriptional regulator
LLDSSVTDGIIIVAPSAIHFNAVSPIVVIDPQNDNPGYPSVIAQNREGARIAVDYLLSLGHRRIGFIGGRPELQSAIQRLQGYQESLAAAGIPLDPELVLPGDYSREVGMCGAKRLFGLPNRPTAIFAANDQSAFGVYQAAQEAGLNVPADLSVIGFDNIPEATYITPTLTTVDQFIDQMGFTATNVLVQYLTDWDKDSMTYSSPVQLVIRESCSSVRRK